MTGAGSVVAGLVLILTVVPFCSYVRVERLQRVASASSLSSTEGTACLDTASPIKWLSRPAVLLTCWALGAEPEDLLVAFQPYFVRIVSLSGIAFVIPFG